MALYFVNKEAQVNGDHEVHKLSCDHMPAEENRIYLGEFISCISALVRAREFYSQVNGCYYCTEECHTS